MIETRSIDELMALVRLEDIAANEGLHLRAVRGSMKGACPKCREASKKNKEPFTIKVKEQYWKCFHCDWKGNKPAQFLEDLRGLKWKEAVQYMADLYKFELKHNTTAATTGDAFDTSYFTERMEAIGYAQDRPADKGLFRARTDGGIEIRYPELQPGETIWQQHKGEAYVRIRLHPSRTQAGKKYDAPSGSGVHVFVPPVVVAEYRANVQWEVLYVVEGEFKAFATARPGVPVVGIGGIKMYLEKKGSHNLHADLVQLLRNAKAVCLVHDADATQVKWNPDTEPDKDLGQRLSDFAGAVTGFRRSVGTLVPRVHYTRIKESWVNKAKGLDDLAALEGVDKVVERLCELGSNTYFDARDITSEEWRGINKIFDLNLYAGVPRAFYNRRQELIGERQFRFRGGTYRYVREDEEASEGKLEMIQHPDSSMFVAVGCDFYKKLTKLDHNERPQPHLEKWSESNLQRNYVRNGVPRFLHTLDTYDAFIVAPGHHEDYRTEVVVQLEEFGARSRFLNKYKPLDYAPRKGEYPVITAFLKHIFGTQVLESRTRSGEVVASSEAWVVYVDRLTVMYRYPRQRVPAVVLASDERNTGKSTVLDLNMALWGGNGVVIGNDAIASQFNANWIDCSYVGINEAMLKRKEDGEKLKDLMTSPVTQRRGMYKDGEQSVNFTKFDITTNSPDKFLEISDDEFRYWVNVVPKYQGEEDADLLKKMIAELPALIYDLRHRAIVHPRMGRLWFANSVIDNEARRTAARASASWCEKDVRAWLEEQFYTYQWPELYFTRTQVRDGVNDKNGTKYKLFEVTEVLQKNLKAHEESTWVHVPKLPTARIEAAKSSGEITTYDKQRWMMFRAAAFMKSEEAADVLNEARAQWAVASDSIETSGHTKEFKLHCPEPKQP